MNYGDTSNLMHPKSYFNRGFFSGNEINPDLLGKYARSSTNLFFKNHVPLPVLEGVYIQLFNSFEQERVYNNVEDVADIIRARIFCEPFINFPFLMEFIDSGLLAAESENDIEAFFVHFHKIIDLLKYSKMEGPMEF